MEFQETGETEQSRVQKLRSFFIECARVLKITKKPSMLEFKTIVKAASLGMAIIGLMGFTVQMIKILVFGK